MRSIDLTPYYRSSVGFDRMLNALGRAQRTPEVEAALPPYNVEAIGDERYRITMALAGWSVDEILIMAEANVLRVEGEFAPDQDTRNFLHCGIVRQPFRCQFELADFVVVVGAAFDHGLLSIDLERQIPEAMKPRKIDISGARSSEPPQRRRPVEPLQQGADS
jgi:molecular chaperone IbpA